MGTVDGSDDEGEEVVVVVVDDDDDDRRNSEVILPIIWTDGKAQVRRAREERRNVKMKEEKR